MRGHPKRTRYVNHLVNPPPSRKELLLSVRGRIEVPLEPCYTHMYILESLISTLFFSLDGANRLTYRPRHENPRPFFLEFMNFFCNYITMYMDTREK